MVRDHLRLEVLPRKNLPMSTILFLHKNLRRNLPCQKGVTMVSSVGPSPLPYTQKKKGHRVLLGATAVGRYIGDLKCFATHAIQK
jgi:hypothetical protein